ncbi:MAG TPA: FAD-dependent oxidoreductase [bacterium]|nr:FAD-dependent oxidoreductase [bacterium]
MAAYKYLIIGGGMTADAAIGGIRQVDPSGSVALIGSEPHPPYNRPPLSKALWKGEPVDSVWRRTDRHGVDLHLGRTARILDIGRRQVTDDRGTTYTWERLLLATGGTPRRLGFGDDRTIYYRTFDDYTRLRALSEQGRRFAVIGSGFIGSEIAAALAMNHKDVVMLFPGEGIGGRIYPRELALFLNDFYRKKGVDVQPGQKVVGLREKGPQTALTTQSGGELLVDGVVAGLGIEPNTELARAAGLAVENGIVVDDACRTSHRDIYAAGDAAAFYNPALETRIRVEHEDNANTMGRTAGQAMAGEAVSYKHLPYFYSDLFELGYEAVGELDAHLETFTDWKHPYREGVVYYLRRGRVRGVLLWNTWDQVEAARRLIAEPGPFHPEDLKERLPAKP